MSDYNFEKLKKKNKIISQFKKIIFMFCMNILRLFILKGLIYNSENDRQGSITFTSWLNFLHQNLLFPGSFDVYEQNVLCTLTSFSKMMSPKDKVVVASLVVRMPLQLCIILPPTTKFATIFILLSYLELWPASSAWIEICLDEFLLKAKLS